MEPLPSFRSTLVRAEADLNKNKAMQRMPEQNMSGNYSTRVYLGATPAWNGSGYTVIASLAMTFVIFRKKNGRVRRFNDEDFT